MSRRFHGLAIAVLALMVGFSLPAAADMASRVKLEPNLVEIGPFFGGTTVSVSGTAPPDSQVAVVVKGPSEDQVFKKKGRVLGVLWMNRGEVIFQHVPSVYLVYTTPGLTPADEKIGGFGYQEVEQEAVIRSKEHDTGALFREFVKLKESDGLYAWRSGGVQFGGQDQNGRRFQATVSIAARMPQGDYQVRVLAVRGQRVETLYQGRLKAEETQILLQLSNLAKNYGLLYGILAVLVAIGAGLLMDLLFGGKKVPH